MAWTALQASLARAPGATVSNIREMTCGVCGGDGTTRHCDVGGGKWDESCYQCRGKGTVKVIDQPAKVRR